MLPSIAKTGIHRRLLADKQVSLFKTVHVAVFDIVDGREKYLYLLAILIGIMVRRGTSSSPLRVSPLYRKATILDSHIDKVTQSLQLVAFSKYVPPHIVIIRRAISLTIIGLLVIYSFAPYLLKANTVLFYPSTCLGGWAVPNNASGAPSDPVSYSANTSAVLTANTHAELYCGSFEGEVPAGTVPHDTKLVVHWQAPMSDEPESTPSETQDVVDIVSEDFASSTQEILDAPEETVTFTSQVPEAKEEAEIQPEETPASVETEAVIEKAETESTEPPVQSETVSPSSEPEPVSSRILKMLIGAVVQSAYAEESTETPVEVTPVVEEPVVEAAPETTQVDTVEVTSTETVVENQEPTSDESASQPTEPTQAPSAEAEGGAPESRPAENDESIVMEEPEEATPVHPTVIEAQKKEAERLEAILPPFVEVLYTFDGVNWTSLATFAPSEINSNPLTIPYEVGTTWKSLQSLQVKVKSLQTFDQVPTLYVDAIELQIGYKKKYDTRVDSDQNATDIEIDDETGQKILLFAEERLHQIKGLTPYLAVVSLYTGEDTTTKRSLWMYDIENNKRLQVATSTEIDFTSPLGVKDGYIFWRADTGKKMYAFDTKHKTYQVKEVKPFDVSEGERGEVTFEDLPWKVIVTGESILFWKEETGEIFSDENSEALENFKVEFRLDEVLSSQEKDNVGIPMSTEGSVVN